MISSNISKLNGSCGWVSIFVLVHFYMIYLEVCGGIENTEYYK